MHKEGRQQLRERAIRCLSPHRPRDWISGLENAPQLGYVFLLRNVLLGQRTGSAKSNPFELGTQNNELWFSSLLRDDNNVINNLIVGGMHVSLSGQALQKFEELGLSKAR
jgi:hypothetical protein